MVSIAGGEPLIHDEIHQIVAELIERKRFIYLCTNTLLMQRKLDLFTPSVYFAWSIHLDGLRSGHDEAVCRDGVFDKAVDAIREAQRRGFRVTTNTTFFEQRRRGNDPSRSSTPQRRAEGRHACRSPPGTPTRKRRIKSISSASSGRVRSSAKRSRAAAANVAAQSHPLYPRFPGRQGRFRLHRVGNSVVLGLRVAAAVLPDVPTRRTRRPTRSCSKRRTGRSYGRGRHPKCEELHGALRLRADGRDGDHEICPGDGPGDLWVGGASFSPGPPASSAAMFSVRCWPRATRCAHSHGTARPRLGSRAPR